MLCKDLRMLPESIVFGACKAWFNGIPTYARIQHEERSCRFLCKDWLGSIHHLVNCFILH